MRAAPLCRILLFLVALAPAQVAIAQPPPPPPPPTPLGNPPVPPANPITLAKTNLGKVLFWDEQMSSTRTSACGSCHQAGRGGSDPRSSDGAARATNPGLDALLGTADDVIGSPGVPLAQADGTYLLATHYRLREQVTGRHSPSHINAAFAPLLFWDGRAGQQFLDPVSGAIVLNAGGALENQAIGPPVSSAEMGHVGRDWNDVAARIAASRPLALATTVPTDLAAWIAGRGYPLLFSEAFGSPAVTPSRIALAIATYERTLVSNQTPFDSALAGLAALTPQENAGRQLFGALPCAGCHAGGLTSDNGFHYIGVRPAAEDSARMLVTHNPVDLGAFKTPSLRNVELRGSYFHNGRFSTLEQVIDFYDRGGDFNAPNKAPGVLPLNLTPQQKAALAAFLRRPLTDPRVARQSFPFDRPSLYGESELRPVLEGPGVAGSGGAAPMAIAIEPPLAGNPAFTVGIDGALGGAHAVLVIDANEPATGAGIPASGSFARVEVTLGGLGAAQGFGSATLAIPDDPALYGQVLFGRWYVDDPAAAGGVAASPAFRFRVFGAGGQGVLAVDPAPAVAAITRPLRLEPSLPNPFRSRTAFRYELFAASPARLVVHDVAGRAVRHLVDSPLQLAGRYAIDWDGRDDRGQPLGAGVYFYRLNVTGGAETHRTVKLD